jgi:hypothetical protein
MFNYHRLKGVCVMHSAWVYRWATAYMNIVREKWLMNVYVPELKCVYILYKPG